MNHKLWLGIMPLVGLLAACGGGGDTSNLNTEFIPQQPDYKGITAAAPLTVINSSDITSQTFNIIRLADQIPWGVGPLGIVNGYIHNASLPNNSGNTSIPIVTVNCQSGGSRIETFYLDNLGHGNFTIEYKNCGQWPWVFSGKAEGTATGTNSDSVVKVNMDIVVDDPESQKRYGFKGNIIHTSTTYTLTTVNNLLISNMLTNQTFYLQDLTNSEVYDFSLAEYFPTDRKVNLKGAIYLSDQGRVDVSSITPFTDKWIGALGVSGANQSNAQFAMVPTDDSSGPMISTLKVDTDGNGAAEFEGYFATAAPSSALIPTINWPTESVVHQGYEMALSARQSQAPNGRALSIHWQVLSKPVGSTISPPTPEAPDTTLVFDKIGTYIVQLTVSDGINTATSSIVVGVQAP